MHGSEKPQKPKKLKSILSTQKFPKARSFAASDSDLMGMMKMIKGQLDRLIDIEARKADAFEKMVEFMSNKKCDWHN